MTEDDATREATGVPAVGAPAAPLELGMSEPDASPSFAEAPYDPARTRESMRGTIALLLIALLGGMIACSFVLLWTHPERSGQLHDLLTLIFSPLVALVGAATGYYFGSQSTSAR